MDWVFDTFTELCGQLISEGDVGRTAWVEETQLRYQALRSGHGAACWTAIAGPSGANAVPSGEYQSLQRTFTFEDLDVALEEETVAAIDLGDPLPAGAIVLAVICVISQAFSDGAMGTFSADVGVSAGD